jgi:hypothetical protein
VNTASTITRGFVNAMKSGNRAAKWGREVSRRRDKAIALLFMIGSSIEICSCKVGYLEFTGLAAAL